MSRLVSIGMVSLACAAVLAVVGGCAGTGDVGAVGETGASELPAWVLIVPGGGHVRTTYVGGYPAAQTADAGIAKAEEDVRSQISGDAREYMFDLCRMGYKSAGIAMPTTQKRRFQDHLINVFKERLLTALHREDVYYRPCGVRDGHEGEKVAGYERVCQIFVLMKLDDDAWRRHTIDTLEAARKGFVEDGQSDEANLAGWILDNYRGRQAPRAPAKR